MSSIIFQNIIDKISSTSNNINNYFDNIDSYNNNLYDIIVKLPKYNIIIYFFIVLILFNFIGRLNVRLIEILAFMVCVTVIYYFVHKDYKTFIGFTNKKKLQLKFLHKLMFNDNNWIFEKKDELVIKPVSSSQKSYLYLNPLIIELFYNCREYSQYNITSFIRSLYNKLFKSSSNGLSAFSDGVVICTFFTVVVPGVFDTL